MSILDQVFTFQVMVWVIPCAMVCVALGAILGREIAVRKMSKRLKRERRFLYKTLQTLMESTEQLSTDVGTHNSDLSSMHDVVVDVHSSGDLEPIQEILLEKINEVVASKQTIGRRPGRDPLPFGRPSAAVGHDPQRSTARINSSGLGNRKSFDEAIKFAISNFKSKRIPFALILADVDHFKRINDTHGHQSGDKVVSQIGETLRHVCRGHDHIARYGGDEFAIILMKVPPEPAHNAASRIRAAIEQTNFSVGGAGGRISVTFSMGMAFPTDDDTAEGIISRADQALYESKKRGRNQLQVAGTIPKQPTLPTEALEDTMAIPEPPAVAEAN